MRRALPIARSRVQSTILFNSYQTLANGAKYEPLMVAGDEEYKEPNRLVQTIIASIVIATVILPIGTYFILKA